jgi:hypothetical protein
MNSKKIAAAVAVAVVAVGGYWYYSPHLAMKSMQAAAHKQDADAFNERVDFPKLRESLKGQMSAIMAERMGETSGSGAEALGAMLGMAMVNQFVEAFVRPEVVMRAMSSGQLKPASGKGTPASEDGPSDTNKVEWSIERKGSDKVVAYGRERGQASGEKSVGLVFERYGFVDWKLTEIRLPQ